MNGGDHRVGGAEGGSDHPSEFPRSFADNPQLQEALEAYAAALSAGDRPPREKFLEDFAEGGPRLAEALDALEQLYGVLPAVRLSQSAADSSLPVTPDSLAEFRIIRELGRGGMGVVYEAVEKSLDRRVALKVLPFAAALDPRSLARFRQESLAAAQLVHPHIVRVYGVGSDRGVHYYAMQYIAGLSLAHVIAEMRQREADQTAEGMEETVAGVASNFSTERTTNRPGYFRAVARLGVQVARALDYAHTHGILHRDIKPGNLLLDEQGNIWVTDFGLARIENEANLTLTGDVLGTLRYMSPEQARARRGLVDQRTDIYSLGATLYELLTLEAAFPSEDRGELLRQIAQDDPSPPRQFDRSIPIEIETIVMKALERDPADRYATAHDLSLDLQRYLDDQPLAARPATPVERLVKWSRRHRPLVASLAVSLVLSLVGVVVVAVLYGWNQQQIAADRAQLVQDQEDQQQQTEIELHAARLGKAEAVQIAGGPSYREEVWAILKEAVEQNVPDKHLDTVKRLALACLGDPFGMGPVSEPQVARRAASAIPEHFRNRLGEFRRFNTKAVTAVSEDGQWMALGGNGTGIDVVDKSSNLRSIASSLGFIHGLEFDASGRLLAAACEEGFLVWTVPEFTLELKIRGEVIRSLAFQPAGPLLAVMNRELRVELWSLASHRLVHRLSMPRPTTRVEFSQDGAHLLALVGDVVVAAYSIAATPEKRFLHAHTGAVTAIAFSPDGQSLASVSKDRTVRMWDASTGKVRMTLSGHRSEIQDVAYSPDGKLLASAEWGGGIIVWDATTGRRAIQIDASDVPGQIWRLRFEPHGMYLAAAGRNGFAGWSLGAAPEQATPLRLFAVKHPTYTDPPPRAVEHSQSSTLFDLAIHPAGKELAVLDGAGQIFAWRFSDGGPPRLLLRAGAINFPSLSFDPSGTELSYVTARNAVALWDWERGSTARLTRQEFTETSVLRLARAPDGRRLAVAAGASQIVVYDLDADQELVRLPRETAEIWALNWNPEGTRLAIGLSDGSAAIWDVARVCDALGELGIELPPLTAGRRSPVAPAAIGDDDISQAAAVDLRNQMAALRKDTRTALRKLNFLELYQLSFRAVKLAVQCRADSRLPRNLQWELIQVLNEAAYRLAGFQLHDHAERLFREAIAVASPPSVAAARVDIARSYLGLGMCQETRRQVADAVALYRQALEVLGEYGDDEPPLPEFEAMRLAVVTDLGRVLTATAHTDEAEEILRQAVERWDAFAGSTAVDTPAPRIQAAYLLSKLSVRMGRCADAESHLLSVLRLRPQNAECQSRLAWLLANAPDPTFRRSDEAVRWAQKAVESAPAHGPFWRALGAAHYRAGQWEPAVRALHTARGMERGRDFSWDGFFLTMCEWRLGHEAESRKWFAASRHWMDRLAGDNTPLAELRREAAALIAAGDQILSASHAPASDSDDEIALLGEILDADPHARWALVERAGRYVARGHHAAAAADLQKAAALPGAARDDWRALATGFQRAECWAEAVASLGRLLEVDPLNHQALNELAWILATSPADELRDADRAADLAAQALALDPMNGSYENTLGVAEYRRENWNVSYAALLRSLDLLGERAFAHNGYFLALVTDRLGDRSLAEKWYAASMVWGARFAADDKETARFDREAAAALELPDPPEGGVQPSPQDDPRIYTLISTILPRESWVFFRRAECFAALGEREKMRADLLAALELGSNDLLTLYRIESLAVSVGDWESVLLVSPNLPANRHEYWTLIAFRARARAERGDWDQALEDVAGMQEVTPNEDSLLIFQAAVQLAANDAPSHRRSLANMATRAATPVLPRDAIPFLDPLLAADEGIDVQQVAALAERAAAAAPENERWLGAARYRIGEYAAAVEAFARAARTAPLRPLDHLFLAMAHHRLNHVEDAKAELRKGSEFVPTAGLVKVENAAQVLLDWSNRRTFDHLRNEAERVISP